MADQHADTSWVEECMAKQRQEIPKCARCHKTTGRGHCNECGGCRPKPSGDVLHESWCSRASQHDDGKVADQS